MDLKNNVIIEVIDCTVVQGDQEVLSNVSFTLDKGEFVYVIGKTGSGKTSVLKILYADLPLRKGDIKVVGITVANIKQHKIPLLRRKIGIVFQGFELFYDRTVVDNLKFVLKATGWNNSSKIKKQIANVLMKVGLGSIQKKFPHQLSGGEQQRVAIARALLNDPEILIADEPTGNLDPMVSDEIMQLFEEINVGGTAVLMATHNYTFIDKYPHRILKCEEGKLLDSTLQRFELTSEWGRGL